AIRDSRDGGVRRSRRPPGAGTVELAPATAVRLDSNHILASVRALGPVPHLVRRTRTARSRWAAFPESLRTTRREMDSARTRAIPAACSRALRLRPPYRP